jgi:hypothetical protein
MTATATTVLPFTNPTRTRVIPDWPYGGSRRGPCTLRVDADPKRGERIVKTTFGKPKADTFGHRAAFVDGADGRVYALVEARLGGFIKVRRVTDFCDAKVIPGKWGVLESSAFPDDPHYAELVAVLDAAV